MSEKSSCGFTPCGVEVQRDGDQADVAGAPAVAEQAAFDAIRAGHDRELSGRNASAAVVVGVQVTDQYAVARIDMAGQTIQSGRRSCSAWRTRWSPAN